MDNVSSSRSASETSENVSGFAFFHRLFPLKYVFACSIFFIQTLNKISTRVIQKKTKSSSKKMSQESALKFDQRETVFEKYKPIGVFIYKITENNCCLGYFAEFIQSLKRYPTSLDKISILT